MSRTCPDCQSQYDEAILRCPRDGADLSGSDRGDEMIGRTIGSYRVVEVLGRGGMGTVYMAEHPVIKSRVAIKFLHAQYATDRKIVDRFFNEARAVNVIGHDNILKIIDLNVTDDHRHYFIMELLRGKPLQALMEPGEGMPLEVAGPILLQVCEALEAAHEHQIIHRDLKPDNVYLIDHKGKQNFVKLVDFGIARLTDEQGLSAGSTQTGMVMGTPGYMSPEQAGGLTARIDARSDVYSLGCMMYQMACGRLPFRGASFGEVLIGHLQLPPPPLRELDPEIPEAYEAVVLKCLEKEQKRRYQSMRELHDAIACVMQELGISRELPAAIPAEAGPAGNRALRSSRGVRTPAQRPPRPAAPQKPPSLPGQKTTVPPQGTRVETPGQKPRLGLFLALGAAGLALTLAAVFFLLQQREGAPRAAPLAAQSLSAGTREAAAREVAAREAEEERAQKNARVFLSVVSEPLGALAEASWQEGKKAAKTPFDLSVPKNATVHFSFSKAGHLAYSTDVVADAPQVVKASLQAEVRAPPLKAAPIVRPKPARSGETRNPDDTLPVEF